MHRTLGNSAEALKYFDIAISLDPKEGTALKVCQIQDSSSPLMISVCLLERGTVRERERVAQVCINSVYLSLCVSVCVCVCVCVVFR